MEDLARISLKKEPLYIGVHDDRETSTAEGLEQGYVVCPADRRFLLLFTFLKKNMKKKIMVFAKNKQNKERRGEGCDLFAAPLTTAILVQVFFNACNSVKFHSELLNYIDIPCLDIHVIERKNTKKTLLLFLLFFFSWLQPCAAVFFLFLLAPPCILGLMTML